MPSTETKRVPRKRYVFKTRDDAETAQRAASIESSRNYFVAIAYRAGMVLPCFESGQFSADLVTHHATTGRILYGGPYVVVVDKLSHCSPQIFDAHEWSARERAVQVSPDNQSGFDYRELAEQVSQFINRESL